MFLGTCAETRRVRMKSVAISREKKVDGVLQSPMLPIVRDVLKVKKMVTLGR